MDRLRNDFNGGFREFRKREKPGREIERERPGRERGGGLMKGEVDT